MKQANRFNVACYRASLKPTFEAPAIQVAFKFSRS